MGQITVIKRNGSRTPFDGERISNAIMKAMQAEGTIDKEAADAIAASAQSVFQRKEVTVHEIETYVYTSLTSYGFPLVARAYEGYRAKREFQRERHTVDENILGIVSGSNEEMASENSNKNASVAATQRDLIAGEVSKDMARRMILPTHIAQAHDDGIIHFHDLDYLIQPIHNCTLVNLKDMFANGTVINKKLIETPKSFQTACTLATQIVQQVANGQYGGQTISVAHLAPYLRASFERIKKEVAADLEDAYGAGRATLEAITSIASKRLKRELKSGIQTIQYQVNTFSTSNGQAPFLSVFMYLNEEPEYVEETAMIIEEVIRQRYAGMKNEAGLIVTPAFPKLLYVLDDNNVPEDSKYRYLTDLAVKCVAKRMMPDFISAKKMKESYDDVFPCMGPVDGDEAVIYKVHGRLEVKTLREMWEIFSETNDVVPMTGRERIDLKGVTIYDSSVSGFVECRHIWKNEDKENWVKLVFSDGKELIATDDHPLPVLGRGRTLVRDIESSDCLPVADRGYALQGVSFEDARNSSVFLNMVDMKKLSYEINIKNGNVIVQVSCGGDRASTKKMYTFFEATSNEKGGLEIKHSPKDGWYIEISGGIFNGGIEKCEVASIEKLPDLHESSYCVTTETDRFDVSGICSHNCRSFLSQYRDENGSLKWYGRFNQGVVTLNLADAGLSAKGDIEKFWSIMNERADLCRNALMLRHNKLKGTPVEMSPIHWMHGAIGRSKHGEVIDKYLEEGYSTLSLGYIGLHECVLALLGGSHTTQDGEKLAVEIMKFLRKCCDEWRAETHLGFSLYGTPSESTTYRLAKATRSRFGVVEGITDRDYLTNSYHVDVTEKIDAFEKIDFEAQFQKISSGGCISYVEVPNLEQNLDVVRLLVDFMHGHTQYAEINTKSDVCSNCGFTGEILLNDDMEWECPNCHTTDHNLLTVCRRTCGLTSPNCPR